MQQGALATNQAENDAKHLPQEGDIVLGRVSTEVEFSRTQLEKNTASQSAPGDSPAANKRVNQRPQMSLSQALMGSYRPNQAWQHDFVEVALVKLS